MLYHTSEAKSAEEMTKILLRLPETEREKLYYVMCGVELTVDRLAQQAEA